MKYMGFFKQEKKDDDEKNSIPLEEAPILRAKIKSIDEELEKVYKEIAMQRESLFEQKQKLRKVREENALLKQQKKELSAENKGIGEKIEQITPRLGSVQA